MDNDCVIVPGFGGFIANRITASYDKKSNRFLPPKRMVGFNPHLTMNDSLLAQAYVGHYDISYPEALRRIEDEVDSFKQLIESEREHYICGVGRIVLTDAGKYDFIPDASGLVSPDLYGFDSFEIECISADADEDNVDDIEDSAEPESVDEPKVIPMKSVFGPQKAASMASTAMAASKDADDDEKSVRVPVSIIRHIAVACIVLVAFLTFPSRLGDSQVSPVRQSSIDTNLLYEILPKEMTSGKPDSLRSIVGTERNVKTPVETKAEVPAVVDTATFKYSIVLASRITHKNAMAYVDNLHRKGVVDARVYTLGNTNMVVYKSFASKQDADNALRQVKRNAEFADSWITKIK